MQLTRIGPFALEETLDGESEGNILRGIHVERQLTMAVKLLSKDIVNRPMRGSTFADDFKTLQKMQHPGIVRYYGGAIENGQPYLALELVEGESLRKRLDRRGRLPWEVTVDLADEICVALHHAHARGIVHQRLTPTRILFTDTDQAKLTGFDCSWADRDDVLGLRCPMEIAHYISPEVFKGKQSASSPQGDLFSLGVILYECLTGELPWNANSPSELVMTRRDTPVPRVSTHVLDCPVWLDVLVEKLLQVKRKNRFTSAEETHRAIVNAKRKVASGAGATQQAFSGQKGTLAVAQDRAEVKRLKKRRTKKRDTSPFYERVWFLALSLIAVIGVGAWILWPPTEDALFSYAKPLMESDSSLDWTRAEELYLESFRERFPESKYADELEEFDNKVAINRAEKRLNKNERLRRAPDSEAERQFGEARSLERFGDRFSAWDKYKALVNLFKASDDKYDQAFVALARRQMDRIEESQGEEGSQLEFLEEKLAHATGLIDSGNLMEARIVLEGLVELYDKNLELRPIVLRAKDELRRLDLSVK